MGLQYILFFKIRRKMGKGFKSYILHIDFYISFVQSLIGTRFLNWNNPRQTYKHSKGLTLDTSLLKEIFSKIPLDSNGGK